MRNSWCNTFGIKHELPSEGHRTNTKRHVSFMFMSYCFARFIMPTATVDHGQFFSVHKHGWAASRTYQMKLRHHQGGWHETLMSLFGSALRGYFTLKKQSFNSVCQSVLRYDLTLSTLRPCDMKLN